MLPPKAIEQIPRQKPTEAMVPCDKPSKVPENIHEMPVDAAVNEILRAHNTDSFALKECARKQKALTDHINSD